MLLQIPRVVLRREGRAAISLGVPHAPDIRHLRLTSIAPSWRRPCFSKVVNPGLWPSVTCAVE